MSKIFGENDFFEEIRRFDDELRSIICPVDDIVKLWVLNRRGRYFEDLIGLLDESCDGVVLIDEHFKDI